MMGAAGPLPGAGLSSEEWGSPARGRARDGALRRGDGLSGEGTGLSGEGAGLSGEEAGLSGEEAGLSGEGAGLLLFCNTFLHNWQNAA